MRLMRLIDETETNYQVRTWLKRMEIKYILYWSLYWGIWSFKLENWFFFFLYKTYSRLFSQIFKNGEILQLKYNSKHVGNNIDWSYEIRMQQYYQKSLIGAMSVIRIAAIANDDRILPPLMHSQHHKWFKVLMSFFVRSFRTLTLLYIFVRLETTEKTVLFRQMQLA